REPGVLERPLRVLVHQPARGHQVPRHLLGGVALQAAQVASHLGVEVRGRDVVAQRRLGHLRGGLHRALGALLPGRGVGEPAPGARPAPLRSARLFTAARPAAGAACAPLVAVAVAPLARGAVVPPPAAAVAAPAPLVTPVLPRSPVARRTGVPPVPRVRAVGSLSTVALVAVAERPPPACRPIAVPAAGVAAFGPWLALPAGAVVPPARRGVPAPGAAVAALVVATPRPALVPRPAARAAAAIAAVAALLAVRPAIAPLVRAAFTAAELLPAGPESRRAALPAAVVVLPASCPAAPWAGLPITGSAAAVAIFSRAVIAGTIRDTHLKRIQKSGPPPGGGGPQHVECRRRPTLPHPNECSTIGAGGLSF